MGIMMLAASKDSTITLITDGEDERQAMEEMQSLIQERFGEAE
jgi:phosphocarrier protein